MSLRPPPSHHGGPKVFPDALDAVHLEDGEVVDGEQVGADVGAQDALQGAVKVGTVEVVEHPGA